VRDWSHRTANPQQHGNIAHFGKIKSEVELPGARRRKRAVAVGKREAELNDFQQIHIASQRLVVI
jgi:hypothetical protein